MREELADGDVLFAACGKLGDVLCDGVVEGELVCLVELHDRGGSGEALGERGHVEDGVFGHRLGGEVAGDAGLSGELAVAVGALEDDLAVVADDDDGAGELLRGDGVVDEGG